jgi:phosphate transport system substrate-binding protein
LLLTLFTRIKGKKMKISQRRSAGFLAGVLLLSLLLVACGGSNPTQATLPQTTPTANPNIPTPTISVSGFAEPGGGYKVNANVTLKSGGASFPYPAYLRWLSDFTKLNPTIKLNYDSVGSGAGRKGFFEGEYDFAGTDSYPTEDEVKKYGKEIVSIPTLVGSIAIVYNLPGLKELKVSPETLGGIYTGKITKWSDPRILAENNNLPLPDIPIKLAVRGDSSGTSDVFSGWLAEVSPDFGALRIGGGLPEWEKGGISVAKGLQNDGVAKIVRENIGSFGYIEGSYALANNFSYALVKNAAGKYVGINQVSVGASASLSSVPDDLRLKVSNSKNPEAYPITATSWLIFPKDLPNKEKAEVLVRFVWWSVSDPTALRAAQDLGFGNLSPAIVNKIQATLKNITAVGQPLLK